MLTKQQAVQLARISRVQLLMYDDKDFMPDEWVISAIIEASRGDLHLKMKAATENKNLNTSLH